MPLIYALVARGKTVLAEYTDSDGNFPTVTRLLLSRIQPDKSKMSYVYDGYVFHYILREGLTYLCMSDAAFGYTVPFTYLEHICQRFQEMYGDKGLVAIALAMNAHFSVELRNALDYFNTHSGNEQFTRVRNQIDDIHSVMIDSIDKILQRGERIDLLVERAEQLNLDAVQFRRQAIRLKRTMFWRSLRWCVCAIGFLGVLSAIIGMFVCGGLTFPTCRM